MSNQQFPKIQMETFAHGYDVFYAAAISFLDDAEKMDVLTKIVPADVVAQYQYSEEKRRDFPLLRFLVGKYFVGGQEVFLSFLNEVSILITRYEKQSKNVGFLGISCREFRKFIKDINSKNIFNLDFYYDETENVFKRKADSATIQTINTNTEHLSEGNKMRYEECVAEFFNFKRKLDGNNELFYNESLDKLKKVVESVLLNSHKKEDGSSPRLHEKKQISKIILGDSVPEFEAMISFVVRQVHHDAEGQPRNFTEKEYVYLWLELNKILYLLNIYKR